MDFFEVTEKRKAIRKYIASKNISRQNLDMILNTVSLAPSAKNLQSFKIYIAKRRNSIIKIAECCYNQRADFIQNAATILVFCQDPEKARQEFGRRGKELYSIQDATIAATYSLLAATALGLGTCWVGNFQTKKMQKVLRTNLRPIAVIVVGYADEDPDRKTRKSLTDLTEEIVYP